MKNFRFPKWFVVIVAAAVFLPLAVDWVAPGEAARPESAPYRRSNV